MDKDLMAGGEELSEKHYACQYGLRQVPHWKPGAQNLVSCFFPIYSNKKEK